MTYLPKEYTGILKSSQWPIPNNWRNLQEKPRLCSSCLEASWKLYLLTAGLGMSSFTGQRNVCPQQRYDRERQDASKWFFFSLKMSRWYKCALIWNVSKNRCKYYQIFSERVTSLHFRLNKFHNSFPRKKEQNLDYDTWLDSTLTSTAQPTQSASNVKKGMPLCLVTCRDWLDHTKS